MTDKPKKPQRRKDARPAEIIEAALQEFAENGFAAAKLTNVARRAGVVKGTIYRYFPSKESLFEAALKPRVSPILEQAEALINGFDGESEAMLRHFINSLYERVFGTDLIILLRIILSEGPRFPEIARLYHDQTIIKGMGLLEKIVARGIERGEFRASPSQQNPLVLIGPLIAAGVWKSTFDAIKPMDIKAMAAAHIDIILYGLLARD